MKTPTHITHQVTTRYWSKWRDWLVEPPAAAICFSLQPPTREQVTHQDKVVDVWLREWEQWQIQHPGGVLRPKTLETPFGPQQIKTHVDFASATALASTHPDTAAHWQRAQSRAQQTLGEGVITPDLRQQLPAIVDLADADYAILLAATTWFRHNPRSGLLPRQVPVEGMHTKWLAKHRRLVRAMLGMGSPTDSNSADANELASDDLDLLGLRALPPLVDLILNDSLDRVRVDELKHLRAPAPELARMALRPSVVLVVENKESALILPDRPGLVVVHSLGNHLGVLTTLPWLQDSQVMYWGDLDRAGLTLLSRARALIPTIRSVLMDVDTLSRYRHLAVPEHLARIDEPAPTLTPEERSTYEALLDGHSFGEHLQLEQERLPEDYVLEQVANALRQVPHL